jgi:predicted class III extradiol MEMO1 family dioxygenase
LFVISSDFCHWGERFRKKLAWNIEFVAFISGKRFRYTYHNKADGPIHASIEKLDFAVSYTITV